jgi:flagellar capping protein FliD
MLRIGNHVAERAFRWLRTVNGIVGIVMLFGGALGIWASYLTLKDIMTNQIAKSFAEQTVQETLTTVAEEQARSIIRDRIEPQAKSLEKEIMEFRQYLDKSEQDFKYKYEALEYQIDKLKQRNLVIQLADKAIVDQDARAFD